jgi:predicted RNase H-like HicB family nuclease
MVDRAVIDEAVAAAQRGPYARVLTREADGGYSAEVLEFPGCLSAGDSAAEAVDNLDEAIGLWVASVVEDGQEVPRPYREAQFSGRLTLRLLPSLHERAAIVAGREGVSLNRLLSTAVAHYVGVHEEAPRAPAPESFARWSGQLASAGRRIAEGAPEPGYGAAPSARLYAVVGDTAIELAPTGVVAAGDTDEGAPGGTGYGAPSR